MQGCMPEVSPIGEYRNPVERTGVARVTGTILKRINDVTLGLSFSGLVSSDKISTSSRTVL